jgi:hypothetical protein
VADESFLIESCEIGADEVVANAIQAVMIKLED